MEVANKPSTTDDDNEVVEVWENDGQNVFDDLWNDDRATTLQFQTHSLPLHHHNKILHYTSYAEAQMTPLDMTYNSNPVTEYYDGTGTLVWLAAKALVWMMDADCDQVFSRYIAANDSSQSCCLVELGCGAGLPGIATSLLLSDTTERWHFRFTDSDSEALDLCRRNCQANQMPPDSYSHEVLSWGKTQLQPSAQVVLATDVLYDVPMITPLLETAAALLQPTHHLLLSHVPRFCLPHTHDDPQTTTTQPFQDLEEYIIQQAQRVGLVLVQTVRPHQALHGTQEIDVTRLKEMHAVLLVFQKQDI